jgi:hypothetical protein
MKAIGLAVAAVMLALPAHAADPEIVRSEGFGCSEQATFAKAIGFANQNDREAFEKFISREIRDGNCDLMHVGDSAFIEKFDAKGMICLRPKGKIDCLWTAEAILR